MKKPILLAPRNAVREVAHNADTDRMLASGSWVRVNTTQPESAATRTQRQYRDRREEAGGKRLDMWISKQAFDCLLAKRQKGETLVALLERLLILPDCTCDKG